MELALLGLDGGAISWVLNLIVLFLVAVYIALVYWTYLDAKRRIEDPVLVACATLASLFPFVGTIVYTILRPPEFIEDRQERELELRAAELRLRQLIEHSCTHCEYPIERNYVRCPNCQRRLRNPCQKCRKPLDPKWASCPYCETEVRRERRRRDDKTGRGGRRDRRTDRPERIEQPARTERERPTARSSSRPAGAEPRRESSSRSSSRPAAVEPRREPSAPGAPRPYGTDTAGPETTGSGSGEPNGSGARPGGATARDGGVRPEGRRSAPFPD